jgi:hypothetical protein
MADVIKTIGAAGSGADFANYQTWFAARTGGAGDRYIGEIITTTGGLSTGLATTGNYAMEIVIRAAAGLEFDPSDPTAPHAIISAGGGINIPSTGSAKLTIENIEVRGTSTSPTTSLINTGSAVANVTIRGCWLRGGRHGCQNSVSGGTLLVENTVVEGAYRAGIQAAFSGVTARNVVIAGCNIEAGTTASYCGMRKDVAGTVIENVVAYGNSVVDFFGATTAATVSFMASGDTSASGTGVLTGVTSAAFADYANDIFTAATGGVLDGTGPSGNDRGIVTTSNPTILLVTPATDVFLARDKATNKGNIVVSGTCTSLGVGATIEARFNGGAWQVVDAAPTTTFSGTLTNQACGVGAVEVRVSNFVTATDSHANIAVGAKFLFWGQSNYSGRANNPQTYTGPAGWWRKRTIETNAQVTATADPFDTYTVNGSIFPLLATNLTAALNCPVLFIGVAAGGTSLAQWQPSQALNNRMLTFYNAEAATGHVEVVSSWIGEGDSVLETAEADFKSRYNTVIDQLKTLTGVNSLLVAPSGENLTSYANVRQWISDIAETSANTAPNEVQIWPLYQKIHYETDTETQLAATAVFNGLISSFYDHGFDETLTKAAVTPTYENLIFNAGYSGNAAKTSYTYVGKQLTLDSGTSVGFSGSVTKTTVTLQSKNQTFSGGYSSDCGLTSLSLVGKQLTLSSGSAISFEGSLIKTSVPITFKSLTLSSGVSVSFEGDVVKLPLNVELKTLALETGTNLPFEGSVVKCNITLLSKQPTLSTGLDLDVVKNTYTFGYKTLEMSQSVFYPIDTSRVYFVGGSKNRTFYIK